MRRTVVKEESVTDFIDREAKNHDRLREVIRGLEWVLSRKPEHPDAEPIPGSSAKSGEQMFLIKTLDSRIQDAGPPLRLIYYYQENKVFFWGISFDNPS